MKAMYVSVLGPLQVFAEEAIHTRFESNKVRALFAYLAVEADRPHSRETLAELFWPESPAQTSLANLRYALADLRKVIGDEEADPPYLLVNRETLQFNSLSNHQLDLTVFTYQLKTTNIENYKQAILLYRGDFLEGFPTIGSDTFEEWVIVKREHFRQQAVEALRLVTDHHEGRGEYQQALPFARQQVELEPWLEEAHQQLMRVLALDGQRSAALAQYDTCRRALADELGVEPTRETTQLYEAIRDGQLEKVPRLLKSEPPAPGEPPFKGLQYFDESDADLFFGREALVTHLAKKIQSRERTISAQFLAIIGASGSGKSSLVRAGLIPTLKRSDAIHTAHVITPNEHPLTALPSEWKKGGTRKNLLFVDQFEELFTLCQSRSERRTFIDALLRISDNGAACVIIALRADFYAACAPYPILRKILSHNQEYIGPMNAEELRRAIEEPARANGWLLEPGLTDLLLRDIGADGERTPEPGALPLLSHALLETWHRRNGRMLTLAGYAESGGISQAITKTAESVFAQFSAEQRSIARNIFLRLTELGEETQETRRRVRLSELVANSLAGRRTEVVLKMLSDARLVTTTETAAEVSHEALIREWGRLRDWLTENREGLRLHRHITESAQEWQNQGRDMELVYRGTRLAQAMDWANSHPEDLNLLEREFLEASRVNEEQVAIERDMQRQRELEAARRLAESERQRAENQTRTSKQLRLRAYSLAGILLIALVFAVAAFLQRNAANKQAHLSSARELALASINNLDADADLSILLALQAVSESESAGGLVPYEVQDALHRAIQNSRIHYTLNSHASGDVMAVAYSPYGKLLATAGGDSTVKLWEAETGKELITLKGHTRVINDIAFDPDGKVLASASDDGTVKIWDIASGQELRTLDFNDGGPWSISYSADGTLLSVAGDTFAQVWDASTGGLIQTLESQHGPVAFSPRANLLATSGDDGTTNLWNAETWELLLSLPYAANAIAFSPDGMRLATAETGLKVWDVSTGEELVSTTGFSAIVRGIEFSPNGDRIATGSQDGTTTIWDAETGERLLGLAGHSGAINAVSYSPQCVAPPEYPFEWCGIWLATASRDGTAKVWNVSPGGSFEVATLPGFSGGFYDEKTLFTVQYIDPREYQKLEVQTWAVTSGGVERVSTVNLNHPLPTFIGSQSADGARLATLMVDNTVTVWDTRSGRELVTHPIDQDETIVALALNPDGTKFATGNIDGRVTIWDAMTGEALVSIMGNVGPEFGVVAFSPDGVHLATGGSQDGTVKIWDVSTGRELLLLKGHTLPIYVISFSSDGEQLATGGMDQTVRVWDAINGENLLILKGHTASILSASFNTDGSRLITGSHDSTMRIWDLSEGKELLTFSGHDGWIDTVGFSPSGKFLFAGSFQDGTVRVYLLGIKELAALARSRLTRSLTKGECQKYLHQATCP